MFYLVLSVVFSVSVSILLKVARSRSVSIDVAIGVNYIVATFLALVVLKPDLSSLDHSWVGVVIAIGLGLLLPSIFVVMGRSVEGAGIIKSDAAQRLSLLLPIIAAFTVFGEDLKWRTGVGIVVAFLALACLLHKPDIEGKEGKGGMSELAVVGLLGGVWLGYGTIDILFKQMAKLGNSFPATLTATFILAGVVMWSGLVVKHIMKRSVEGEEKPAFVNWSSVIGGAILGVLNFGNILFYLKAHVAMHENPSVVFAGMNMGVISVGTLVGWLVFKERLSTINAIGIGIALTAIALLVF